ncbi:MAG: butyrate kinase [Desulfovibrio sp.]|jgi:butyrate kinase|nr:butyrate kinase [Desulfovibrio sp.]
MTGSFRILAINPGSTSTKIAVYDDETQLFNHSIAHSSEELARFQHFADQLPMRKAHLLEALEQKNVALGSLSAVVGRGGKIPPCPEGAISVTEKMVEYLKSRPPFDNHISNLGAILALDIAAPLKIPAYIYDGVTVDQMEDIARLTGLPDFHRHSGSHVLNMRAVARKEAASRGKRLADFNAVICHLGGGITMCAVKNGRMADVLGDEEGPYSPERSGGLPVRQLSALLFKNIHSEVEFARRLRGQGGLVAYLGTNNAQAVEKRITEGDAQAKFIYQGMAYQVAKGIGSLAVALRGGVECIILTGSLAHSKMLTDWIAGQVGFLAPVVLYPGENEMEALALGGLRVLRGEEKPSAFSSEKKVKLHYDA